MAEQKKNALRDIVTVLYITNDNAKFEKDNEFIRMTLTAPNDDGIVETTTYDRIFLHRAFPFDYPYAYISVLDQDSRELGLIANIDELSADAAEMLRQELDRKYYTPVIKQILSLKDKFGFSYWKVMTDEGELSFTLRDTFQSLMKVGGTRIFVNDIDGNRYEIPNIEELDRKSFRKIELFL